MTREELAEDREAKARNRFKSRTFWITVLWMSFVPLSIIGQIFIIGVTLPIASIVSFAGSVSLVYIAGNKGNNIAETMKLNIDAETH